MTPLINQGNKSLSLSKNVSRPPIQFKDEQEHIIPFSLNEQSRNMARVLFFPKPYVVEMKNEFEWTIQLINCTFSTKN